MSHLDYGNSIRIGLSVAAVVSQVYPPYNSHIDPFVGLTNSHMIWLLSLPVTLSLTIALPYFTSV